jgi:hypothetical protein
VKNFSFWAREVYSYTRQELIENTDRILEEFGQVLDETTSDKEALALGMTLVREPLGEGEPILDELKHSYCGNGTYRVSVRPGVRAEKELSEEEEALVARHVGEIAAYDYVSNQSLESSNNRSIRDWEYHRLT